LNKQLTQVVTYRGLAIESIDPKGKAIEVYMESEKKQRFQLDDTERTALMQQRDPAYKAQSTGDVTTPTNEKLVNVLANQPKQKKGGT
jgi:hypothetical protein